MRTFKPLLIVGVICAAIAWSLSASAQRVVGPLPTSVADLTTAREVEIRDVSNAVVVKGTFVKKTDKASEIELAASLSGHTVARASVAGMYGTIGEFLSMTR